MLHYVAHVSHFFRAKIKRSPGKLRLVRDLCYRNLEDRKLLAGISFDSGTGVVSVLGSEMDDISIVTNFSPTETRVTLTGFVAQTFTTSALTKVVFSGLGGNDFFRNDTSIDAEAIGGMGNDRLIGGGGKDVLVGAEDDDVLNGRAGDDILLGNAGQDTMWGGLDNDFLNGSDGSDTLYGEDGNDDLRGGAGIDTLLGGDGNDDLRGDDGNDFIFGNLGSDFASGGDGLDIISGGDGDDFLIGDAGVDVIRGGEGADRLEGGIGADRLFGDFDDDVLIGGLDNDFIRGGAGLDVINGNEGNDTVFADSGNDQIFGNDGDDQLYGGTGDDVIRGGSGKDFIAGEDGDDQLFGDTEADAIYGNAGDDQIWGGDHDDFLVGGDGDDLANGQGGSDLVYGNTGDDDLYGGNDNDRILGNDGNDRLFGEQGTDVLFGQAGSDALVGGVDAADTMIGGDGKDRYLFVGADVIRDLESQDARLEFRNGSANWSNAELKVIDDGLDLMQARTNNTRLLKGTLTQLPVVFIKEFALASNRLGQNELVTISQQVFNPVTGRVETITNSEHQIRFGEWDETDVALNNLHLREVPREMAHNWASSAAIAAVLPNQASFFSSFANLSGWTQTRPAENVITFFDVSLDNKWWFLRSGMFTETLATTNPVEDFSAAWKFYFDPFIASNAKVPFVAKLSLLDDLFTRMEGF